MPARLRSHVTHPDLSGHTVLALHAHPDDESIFTGITLRRLADAGARVVLVLATGGEAGASRLPLGGDTVARRRRRELEEAAGLLGVSRLVLLGRRDSGLPGGPDLRHDRALAGADPLALGRGLAELADAEGAATLIFDDDAGIYGHPDHRAVHAIGETAAALTGATAYRTTVDREHLHVTARGRHLVHGAAAAAATPYGRPTVEITTAVGGSAAELDVKRAAMAAHSSQIDPDTLSGSDFAAAYGYEWFRRDGAPGLLDELGNVHLLAGAR